MNKPLTPSQRAKITSSRRLSTVVDKVKDAVGYDGATLIPFFDDGEPNVEIWETIDNSVDLDVLLEAFAAAGLTASARPMDSGLASVTVTL